MFSRFSGIPADDYARRTGQRPWLSGAAKPGAALGTTTKPLCLCDLQRKKDGMKGGRSAQDRARRSM